MSEITVITPKRWEISADRWVSKTFTIENSPLPESKKRVTVTIDIDRMTVRWRFTDDDNMLVQGWQDIIATTHVVKPVLAENGYKMYYSNLYKECFLTEM